MEIKSQLLLRVNGINITEVKLRHPAVDGHLNPEKYEIEITDSQIGAFTLTDDFQIEIKWASSDTNTEKSSKLNNWLNVDVKQLIKILTPPR